MFPLRKRKIIRGCRAHIRAGLLCAEDDEATVFTPVYAPFDGEITTYQGFQGGNWSRLTRINGDRIEMAHLHSYVVTRGKVREGDLIAYTGNTGRLTSGPHLHIQIIDKNGQRLDPATYLWDNDDMSEELKAQVKRLHAEVRELTAEVHEANRLLEEEKQGREEDIKRAKYNYELWQKSIDRRKKVEVNLKACQQNKLHNMTILEKIRSLFEL